MEEHYQVAIENVTALILHHLKLCAAEEVSPGQTPDASDKYITTHRDAVKRLRGIRADLELTFALKDHLEP